VAAGAGEEASHLAEGHGSDAFQAADSAAECCCAAGGGEEGFLAEMDVQYHLGPQLALIDTGRPDDQRRLGGLLCRVGRLLCRIRRLLCGLNRPEFRAASFLVRKDAIMPKHYDAEVKARAVRLVAEHKVESGSVTKSCEAVGRRLGISKETLRGWCRQAQVDAGGREGVTSEELAEIKRLKAENRRLREDVEILRAATTFFAGELDPRNR
jgi:transposase